MHQSTDCWFAPWSGFVHWRVAGKCGPQGNVRSRCDQIDFRFWWTSIQFTTLSWVSHLLRKSFFYASIFLVCSLFFIECMAFNWRQIMVVCVCVYILLSEFFFFLFSIILLLFWNSYTGINYSIDGGIWSTHAAQTCRRSKWSEQFFFTRNWPRCRINSDLPKQNGDNQCKFIAQFQIHWMECDWQRETYDVILLLVWCCRPQSKLC